MGEEVSVGDALGNGSVGKAGTKARFLHGGRQSGLAGSLLTTTNPSLSMGDWFLY